jgi:hypothetical protein
MKHTFGLFWSILEHLEGLLEVGKKSDCIIGFFNYSPESIKNFKKVILAIISLFQK